MSLLTLPNELILFVAESLPLSNIRALRQSCKRMHDILRRINRRRIVLHDIQHLPHLESELDLLADKFSGAAAFKLSAASVLPVSASSHDLHATSSTMSSRSLYELLALAPDLRYFQLSLLPFSDVNISYIPPFEPTSFPQLTSLTHLSIINFRVTQSFLSAFPNLVQLTLALVLDPDENALQQLQYQPRDICGFLPALTPALERFTATVTNVTPDLVAIIAKRLTRLSALSLVWYPEQDVSHGGVEITDCSKNLTEYIKALQPLRSTLRSLHLPLCVGSHSPLAITDEELGSGPVLSSDRRGHAWRPPSRVNVHVGADETLRACERLSGHLKDPSDGSLLGLDKLERVGWVIPQGDGVPHMLLDCLRVNHDEESTNHSAPAFEFKFDEEIAAALRTHHHRPGSGSIRSESGSSAAFTSESEGSLFNFGATNDSQEFFAPVSSAQPVAPKPNWALSMQWVDGHAWPPSEIEEVFPLGDRYAETVSYAA